jgi:3-deoxy-manno-octulosonate cytidylyltransferase (CMP-KDO synthetase)
MTKEIPFSIYIPARLNSSRLPRKLLLNLAGKPVICHTIDRALEAQPEKIVVVTDSVEIADLVNQYTSELQQIQQSKIIVFNSQKEHDSGTDRISEASIALQEAPEHIIINLQGDEPLLPATHIHSVVGAMADTDLLVATLSVPISAEDAKNSNNVKVVTTKSGAALYFSRSKIPYDRDVAVSSANNDFSYQKHLGLYAYRGELLFAWQEIPQSGLEDLEKLEQLRLLENGFGIQVVEVEEFNGVGIDTQEQLEIAEQMIMGLNKPL